MKSDDHEQFLASMLEEITKLSDSEVWEIFPTGEVPKGQTILEAVWLHRRKTTPDGDV